MLYEIKLANGKCNRPKLAMVTAKDEAKARRKAERIHPGYRVVDVRAMSKA